MAKLILVANWKNSPASLPEAKDLLKGLSKNKLLYKKLRLFLAPPHTYFESVSKSIVGYGELASQSFFPEEKGKYTGYITPEILKSFGVKLVILGHSERRALGETSYEIAHQAKMALKNGLTPLICIGESKRDVEGEYLNLLREELKASLSELSKNDIKKIMLAYEPVWAIGSKSLGAIDPLELSETVLFIRKVLSDLYGRNLAEETPILYGGSVDSVSAGILVRNTGIKGFLVGRASLNAKSFKEVAESLI